MMSVSEADAICHDPYRGRGARVGRYTSVTIGSIGRVGRVGQVGRQLSLLGSPSSAGVVALGLRCLAPLPGPLPGSPTQPSLSGPPSPSLSGPPPPSPPSPALSLRLSLPGRCGSARSALSDSSDLSDLSDKPARTRPIRERALYLVRYFGTFGP